MPVGESARLALLGVLILRVAPACVINTTDDTAGTTPDGASNDSTTGNDGATPPVDSSSGSSSSDSSTSSIPPDSSTRGAEASSPNDGAASLFDANDIPEGGSPVTPNQVACGGKSCDTTANTCCVQADAEATCVPGANTTCQTGATIHCLGSVDCGALSSGALCCGSFDLVSNSASTACSTKACPVGLTQAQFCRTNGECPGGTCTVQVCPSPAMAGTTQQILELCGGVHFGCAAK